jgi:DNA modification methylase
MTPYAVHQAVTPPGGMVLLDPYLGSGTTLVACLREDMRGLGIEREEAYCALAAQRIREEVLPLGPGGP